MRDANELSPELKFPGDLAKRCGGRMLQAEGRASIKVLRKTEPKLFEEQQKKPILLEKSEPGVEHRDGIRMGGVLRE